jgi:Big-like domain-containing protein
MKHSFITAIAAVVLSVALAPPASAGNLLTNGDFEAFTGPFPDGITAANGAITTNSATWNIWRVWERFQSVDDGTLIESTFPLGFPDGWGGDNFAQHSQAFTGDCCDMTDQIKQGIDGDSVVSGKPVNLSFKYINTEGGRSIFVKVYGIDSGQEWSEFAPWNCTDGAVDCTELYTANIQIPYDDTRLNWQTFTDSFTPSTSHTVVAMGIEIGGNTGYARGVDDVVLSQNQPPVCDDAVPSVSALWSPNHKLVPINVLGVTDPDGDPVTINIDSIFQDEPVDGLGDGNTSPDGAGVGTATASVRAERAGGGNGRVYHISFTASDGNGGTCDGTVLVAVPKSKGVKGAAVDGGVLYDSTAP